MATIKKPSQGEEEYIAKQEAVARHKRAQEKAQELADAEKEQLQKLHFMKCPKCGMDLEATTFRGVTIDKCFHCGGSFLDAGELEALAGHEGNVLRGIVDFFKRP
jgi:hypothetical protein